MRAAIVATLGLLVLPSSALGQPVIVRTSPPRATLVCDGRVLGLTPVAVDPTQVHQCTLFARGHVQLPFDPTTLTGVIASYRLEALPPAREPPCNTLDPQTGLLHPCLEERASPRQDVPERRCDHLDPTTGLLTACFSDGEPPDTAPARSAPSPPARRPRCGHLDPTTGLMNLCFTEPAPPRRPRGRTATPAAPRCGFFDPATGLFHPCFR